MTRAIDYRFKILYALGMVFVVAGHGGNGGISLLYDWFPPYSFHLGLFAFCSGYFYNEESENNIAEYCKKKVKRLLVPLYAWNCFYALLIMIMQRWGFTIGAPITLSKLLLKPISNGHQFVYNMGGWFVVPLFMIQVFTVSIRRLFWKINSQYKEHLLILLYILLGIAGIQLANSGYGTDWGLVLVRMLFFCPFFGAGFYYKKVLEKWDNLSNTAYFLAILIIQLAVIVIYGKAPEYTPSWCNNFTDGPILPFLVGFLAIALWLRIARILEPAIGKSKTVSLIADNTFSIMINQFLGFMLVKLVFAVFQKLGIISGFDMNLFKSNIWYYYIPGGVRHAFFIYLLAGISVPICMQRFVDYIKANLFKKAT